MKIAIVSDTHKNKRAIELAKECILQVKPEIIIHLGDCTDDIKYFKEGFSGQVYGVSGNCDFSTNFPKEQIISIQGKKIFFTHGDLYGVKSGYLGLTYRARELNADVALFGHTHLPYNEDVGGLILMNPGSIARPAYRDKGIGIIEIEENGQLHNQLHFITY